MIEQDSNEGASKLDSAALARRIVEIAEAKQANDILLLDIRSVAVFADFFVICSGRSERQLQAMSRDIVKTLVDDERLKPSHTEGEPDSGWILLDYDDVIVHIFAPEQRRYYGLEELWSNAVPVVRIQ